jgi:hypothetical protein
MWGVRAEKVSNCIILLSNLDMSENTFNHEIHI